MEMEKMVYHSKKIYECADMVKAGKPWTTRRKKDHWEMCNKLEKIFSFGEEYINPWIFDMESGYFNAYRKKVWYMENWSKKELDEELRKVLRYLKNELADFIRLIQNGEVEDADSWAGF